MRTNFAGLFLAVGMGLIVVLLGLGVLSMAGLVSFLPDDTLTEQGIPNDEGPVVPEAVPVATVYVPASAEEADAIKIGDALFKANCTQCHAVHEKVVGPALAGITKRRPIAWLVPWVHNSAKVIASGDAYAVKLFDEHGKQQMPSFPQLSDKEIKAIMSWVTSQEAGVSVGTDAPTVAVVE